MSRLRWFVLSLALMVLLIASTVSVGVFAQQGTEVIDPNANITYPPPVYLLRDIVPVRGSANVPNMTSYYVEFRLLNDDLTAQDEDSPWFPALFGQVPVTDDELGLWDTRLIPDGVYELRLRIDLEDEDEPIVYIVSPVRVENEIPDFILTLTPAASATNSQPTLLPTPTSLGSNPRPTAQPTTAGLETQPRVTATTDANVRSGDSTLYPVVGTLRNGESAQIIGVSTTGSGWYLIRLPNGREGWVAPSVVIVAGNLSGVQRLSPPAPPSPTAVPATATSVNTPDLLINGFRFDPTTPTCNQPFNVFINVANVGTGQSNSSGSVFVTDTLNGAVVASASGVFGSPIAVGGNFVVVIAITVPSGFNQTHRITVTLDNGNQVAESNEGNNTFTQDYILAQGTCT